MSKKILITAMSVLMCWNFVFSQVTKVRGKVTDEKTGDVMPLVNVSFKGTTVGTTTDFEGFFFIETRDVSSELVVSFLGYEPQSFQIKKGEFRTLEIKLKPVTVDLDEVKVTPGENPAHRILKNIVKNKYRNDPERYKSHSYKAYTKMELDINNIDESFKKKKIFKKFQFVFNYLDTSVISGSAFLPVMISETVSENYYRKNPHLEKEFIKASKISGIEDNTSISQFTGNLHQKVNVYNNFIELYDMAFVSPIAAQGLNYYEYFLIDSAYRDNVKCYKIRFRPKRKQEPTFTGEFWVTDSTYAIQYIKLRKAKDINLNWVNDFFCETEFQKVRDSIWFLKREKLVSDFNISMKDSTDQLGFIGRRVINYDDVKINMHIPSNIENFVGNMSVGEDVYLKTDDYWKENRPYKLSKRESGIYNMVDSIKDVPLYKTVVDVINTALYGYYEFEKISIGPYFKLYSFNELEGNRFQLGFRTLKGFDKRVRYEGHLAYGDRDKKLKYGAGILFLMNKLPRRAIKLNYLHDVKQLGKSPNAFTESNIMSSALSRNPVNKLNMADEYDIEYHHEWWHGFSNSIRFKYMELTPSENVRFVKGGTNSELTRFKMSKVQINTRWAKEEIVVNGDFDNYRYGSDYPIVNVDMSMGIKGFLGSRYDYFGLDVSIEHSFRVNPFGKFRYLLTAGKMWGEVPYPLLYLHEGNETYAFDPYAFNMMNYYEFASDRYVGLYAEHHFMGYFLDRIPLFRKLKWRTVLSGKLLAGDLTYKNNGAINSNATLRFPEGMDELPGAYMEGGIGIENIFKLLRVDAYWRLSQRDHVTTNNVSNFGIRAMLQLTF